MSPPRSGGEPPGTLAVTGRFSGAMPVDAQPNGRGPVDAALEAQAAC